MFFVAREDAGVAWNRLVPREGEALEPREAPAGRVSYERPDPHTMRIRTSGAPGYVVVVEGHHPDWRAVGPQGPVDLLQANARSWALPVPGGDALFTVRFEPSWPRISLALAAGGVLLAALLCRPEPSRS